MTFHFKTHINELFDKLIRGIKSIAAVSISNYAASCSSAILTRGKDLAAYSKTSSARVSHLLVGNNLPFTRSKILPCKVTIRLFLSKLL